MTAAGVKKTVPDLAALKRSHNTRISPLAQIEFTGTQISYYFVCKRKLWLFSRNIQFEQENEAVQIGRLIDENSYKREKKQLDIGNVKIDFFDKKGVIHEVKKSDAIEISHIYQLKHYIWTLKQLGLPHVSGEIDYPKLKKRKQVTFLPEDEAVFQSIFSGISTILKQAHPPAPVPKPFCKKCAYYEFCFV